MLRRTRRAEKWRVSFFLLHSLASIYSLSLETADLNQCLPFVQKPLWGAYTDVYGNSFAHLFSRALPGGYMSVHHTTTFRLGFILIHSIY